MRYLVAVILCLMMGVGLYAQSPCNNQTSVTYQGYDYDIVEIGDQCWFAENCRHLPSVSSSSDGSETDPYYYVNGYEGSDVEAAKATENYETYGVLYNWPAVMIDGLCPTSWHIPSDGEWQAMEVSLGMSEAEASSTGFRGTDEGYQMKSTSGWNNDGNGSNSSGFNGLPGGFRSYNNFSSYGYFGYWWSASESDSQSWRRELGNGNDGVYRYYDIRYYGFSARCVTDQLIVSTPGCTDPTASNYDPDATDDDGSCEYQKTYVPDDNFEQSLIEQGYDDVLDDYVLTQNINNVDFIDLSWSNISSLTGIEDFTMLSVLLCHHNEIDEISLCSNYALTYLRCNDNFISSIDLSQNLDLNFLRCNNNQLTHLDLTSNVNLTQLYSFSNSSLNCLQVWEIDYVYEQMEQNCIDPIDGGSLPCFQIDSGLNVSLDCNYEVQDDSSCSGIISNTCVASDCCISGTQWDLNTMTCVYDDACSADIAKDGFVAVDDLLELLSAFGSSCDEVVLGIGGEECQGAECCGENTIWCESLEICIPFISCPADLNEDESVGSFDLLVFLPFYGGDCEDYESLPDCEVTASPWMCGDLINYQGYDYATVQIGEQCWFSENCHYLPEVSPSSAYSTTDPYYYVYDYQGTDVTAAMSTENYVTYGVLYNWPAVMTDGICPTSWHIPSDEEFTQLTDFLGGESVAGGKMKEAGYEHWLSPNTGATNSSSFTGLPGGSKASFSNGYYEYGNHGDWWSSSEEVDGSELDPSTSWRRNLSNINDNVDRNHYDKSYGFSVRCIKD